MQKPVRGQEPPGGLLFPSTCSVITQQESVYIFNFFVCFLNNKRILMPHIDYTFYVQPRVSSKKFVSP